MKYELTSYNRLIINKNSKKSKLSKFRKVLDEKFKLDKKYNLSYHVKSPLSSEEKTPHQIKLKENWSLKYDNTLKFTLASATRALYAYIANSSLLKKINLEAADF